MFQKLLATKLGMRLKEQYIKLSQREKIIISIAVLFIGVMLAYSEIVLPVRAAFSSQAQRLRDLEQSIEVAPDMLARYQKLVQRKTEIEQFYENVDAKESPLSHLESLLLNKAQVPAGSYTVNSRPQPDFAEKYKHTAFIVKFDTSNLGTLMAFLRELVKGSQPMLLSQINIEKKLTSDSLSIQLEVSSFEKLSSRI